MQEKTIPYNRHTREQLYKAALALAVGHGNLKKRLANAYDFSLFYIDADSLPEYLRERFKVVMEKLTKKNTKNVSEAIYYWKKTNTHSVASEIFNIFYEYMRDST